jgi:hypothetical protein
MSYYLVQKKKKLIRIFNDNNGDACSYMCFEHPKLKTLMISILMSFEHAKLIEEGINIH